MCARCSENNYVESTTPFTLDYEGKLIVVRDVPCRRCLYCDDVEFSDDVMSRLEAIVSDLKNSNQEVCITRFSQKAA